MAYFRFLNTSTDLLMVRFKFTLLETSNLTSILPIFNMVLIPIMSSIVTVKGKKAGILMWATIIAISIYTTMLFLPEENSWIVSALVLSVSLFYSMYVSCIWSCITLSLPTQLAPVGFGACTLLQSVSSITTTNIISSVSTDRTPSAYNNAIKVLLSLAIIGFLLTLLLRKLDQKSGYLLQLPENSPQVKSLLKSIESKYASHDQINKQVIKPHSTISAPANTS